MRQVARLSGAIVSQLRSGIVLSDLGQVVSELVCNSLDASATQVHVWLDEGASSIRVEDDGCGISRDDLKLVGERHATSKLHTLAELEAGVQTLGFRGEALSSLSHISLMEITSRVRGSPHTYSKIMKGPVTMSFGLSSKQRARGTTVVVRDIFYNQPVRRRLLSNRQVAELNFSRLPFSGLDRKLNY
jgi:DNA mismatch repair protein MLH3